jgi:uncharacterized protein YbbC (DUF1343 family)
VEGPILDAGNLSFIGAFPLPLRHGLTIGELARMENAELKLNADLTVVEMSGWQRNTWFDETGLSWVNPSPNIRSLAAATLYPGLGMLESSPNYSVGRGTASPFEQIGADFIHGKQLADYLTARNIPGVVIQPTRFKPDASNLAGQAIEGVAFQLTDRDVFNASRLGIELALALRHLYPGKIDWLKNKNLVGSSEVVAEIAKGGDPLLTSEAGIAAFQQAREKYLIYR